MRILLVEDEPDAALMLAKGLREQTYAVDIARRRRGGPRTGEPERLRPDNSRFDAAAQWTASRCAARCGPRLRRADTDAHGPRLDTRTGSRGSTREPTITS